MKLAPSRRELWLDGIEDFVLTLVITAILAVFGFSQPVLITAGFATFTILFSIRRLFPRSEHILLSPQGLTIVTLSREHSQPWSYYREFVPVRGWIRDRVAIKYAGKPATLRGLRRIARWFGGYEGYLRYTYGHSAEELAYILNAWRTRHANS